jgi:hypothetical protein
MKRKLALFTFFDALGWEIYKHYGFMADEVRDARPLQTVFGFSSAADPSILSGQYPEAHGHWSSFIYDPKNSPFKLMNLVKHLPRSLFDRWRVRHWLSKLLAKAYRFTGYFEIYSVPFGVLPHFDYLEKRDYFVPGGILKGDTIFDWLSQRGIAYHCSNWRLSETENLAALQQEISKGEIQFAYLYLPALDGLMHGVGTRHAKVAEKLRWYEGELKKILAQARENYDEVSFYAFSDHGMADVVGSVDLIAVIEKLGLKFGQDYVAMYDSTMARFWFPNPAARAQIEQALAQVPEGRVLAGADLKRWHCEFGDTRFGELIFLLKPGLLIVPSFMGLKAIPGMHGYDPNHKDSYACVLSNRVLPKDIHDLTDLRGLMEAEIKQGLEVGV